MTRACGGRKEWESGEEHVLEVRPPGGSLFLRVMLGSARGNNLTVSNKQCALAGVWSNSLGVKVRCWLAGAWYKRVAAWVWRSMVLSLVKAICNLLQPASR